MKMKAEVMGPNEKRLTIRFMSQAAIPAGGGVADGIKFLSDKSAISAGFKNAAVLARESIELLRAAPDANFADDEEAAAAILKALEDSA